MVRAVFTEDGGWDGKGTRRVAANPNCNPNLLSGGMELDFCYNLTDINTGVDSIGIEGGGGLGKIVRNSKA